MDLTVTFRHLDPSEALAQQIERHAEALALKYDPGLRLRAVCTVDGPEHEVELVGTVMKEHVVAKARDTDMYRAVDAVFAKLDHHATHTHDKRTRHRRGEARPVF